MWGDFLFATRQVGHGVNLGSDDEAAEKSFFLFFCSFCLLA
jgi:hypothetical protein